MKYKIYTIFIMLFIKENRLIYNVSSLPISGEFCKGDSCKSVLPALKIKKTADITVITKEHLKHLKKTINGDQEFIQDLVGAKVVTDTQGTWVDVDKDNDGVVDVSYKFNDLFENTINSNSNPNPNPNVYSDESKESAFENTKIIETSSATELIQNWNTNNTSSTMARIKKFKQDASNLLQNKDIRPEQKRGLKKIVQWANFFEKKSKIPSLNVVDDKKTVENVVAKEPTKVEVEVKDPKKVEVKVKEPTQAKMHLPKADEL